MDECISNPEVRWRRYPYECNVCGDAFQKLSELNEHKDHKHCQGGNNFHCRKCRKNFGDKESVNQHMVEYHGGGYHCEKCNQDFKDQQSAKIHMTEYHYIPGSGKRKWLIE